MSAPARSAPGADRGDGLDQWDEREAVVGVGRADGHRQRQARRVGEHVQLGARFAAVDRVRAGQRAPFFARTLAASTTARDQSIAACSPSRASTARCSRRHSPVKYCFAASLEWPR